jgi:hypothetical protein
MTKKDYIKLVSVINGCTRKDNKNIIHRDLLIDGLCDILKADNPLFNESTFRKSCG